MTTHQNKKATQRQKAAKPKQSVHPVDSLQADLLDIIDNPEMVADLVRLVEWAPLHYKNHTQMSKAFKKIVDGMQELKRLGYTGFVFRGVAQIDQQLAWAQTEYEVTRSFAKITDYRKYLITQIACIMGQRGYSVVSTQGGEFERIVTNVLKAAGQKGCDHRILRNVITQLRMKG